MSIEMNRVPRVGYVNLGLFAQAVLECLYSIADRDGLLDSPKPMLEAVLASLRRIRGQEVIGCVRFFLAPR